MAGGVKRRHGCSERRGRLFSWRTPFTAPPLAPGRPTKFSHCGRRAPRPVHCRKIPEGKLRRDTLWRRGLAALTNREGCPLHNAAGWPRVAGNLMPAAGSWILQSLCSLVGYPTRVLSIVRYRYSVYTAVDPIANYAQYYCTSCSCTLLVRCTSIYE